MYKRILLKLSGEALADKTHLQTLNCEKLNAVAAVIKEVTEKGIQVGVVIGAGNIWRGKFASQIGIDHAEADYMGMLGTIINGVALSSALKANGVPSVVLSAIQVDPVTIPFDEKKAKAALEEGKVVVFSGGTGKPFFTTDTAATLRAIQIEADVILMAKNGVDGVYSDDPKKNPNAERYDILTFKEILERKLQVMDLSAVEMLEDKPIEIRVFNMDDCENIVKVATGSTIGTTVRRG